MKKKIVIKSFETLHQDFHNQLSGKKQGFSISIPVGEDLFSASLPPQLEIILLDQKEMTVAFRKVSNSMGKIEEKGRWHVGSTESAGKTLLAWQEQMISLKADNNSWEVKKV
jgi:hypothetical protein